MTRKIKDLRGFLIAAILLIALNWLGTISFLRVDMTEDDRYSLSESSIRVINNITQPVEVDIYLHGDFPARFKTLEQAVREKLEDFKAYNGANIDFEFIDIFEIKEVSRRKEIIQEIQQRGIQPINLNATENGSTIEKLIYPGAIIRYEGREIAVNFLKGMLTDKAENRIQESIENIEYEFIHAIKTVTQEKRKRVAFLLGHGELDQKQVSDLVGHLAPNYEVGFYNLKFNPSIDSIDAVIIAQPTSTFTDQDKYKLDQYIMNGGKALFFLDMVETRKDTSGLIGLPYKLNLEDLLFKYGIRINEDLIKDLYGAPVPVRVGKQYKLVPWGFNPIFSHFNNSHPITHNMGDIYGKNVGTVDTTFAPNVTKTPLIFTSPYVLKHGQPVVFSPEELRFEPRPEAYPTGNLPVAYLLEGEFTSLFRNRPLPKGVSKNGFKTQSTATQIVVVSDGDMVANSIDQQTGRPYELGFDIITKQKFANRDFAINCINYLLDEDGVIDLKLNSLKPRPLDKFLVKNDRTFWQVINVVVPISIVICFGLIQFFLRKRKNTRH